MARVSMTGVLESLLYIGYGLALEFQALVGAPSSLRISPIYNVHHTYQYNHPLQVASSLQHF
jgi:hypothetical protein